MKLLITTQVVDKKHPILGFFHRWVEEFAKYFERIDIICLQEGEHTLPNNVFVHSLGKEKGVSKVSYVVNFYKYFWRGLKQKPDFVFFHMGAIYNILAAPFYIFYPQRPKFYWWKTHGLLAFKDKLALRFVDRVFTAVAESFPIDTKKRQIVGHAIDTNLFTISDKERLVDILFVGRFSRIKRIEQVVEVVQQLVSEGEKISATIIGPVTDDVYYREIVDLIKEKNLQSIIRIKGPGPQQELLAEYQQAKVCMNPSEHEGLDKVVLEAMSAGAIPVTGNTACRELLAPFGLFSKKGDIATFAQVIKSVLDMPDIERGKLRQQLRGQITLHHSIDTITDRIFVSHSN